jgi:NAD dependent epimerase/dehydratase family enzyme
MAAVLAPGQKVAPQVALTAGYAFRHPALTSALAASL